MNQTPLVEPLTEREGEVLAAMAAGLSNQQIAGTLHLALTTVKWYNTQIYGKLGVQNRAEAVQQARLLGLLEDGDREAAAVSNNLPPSTTPFVGRLDELRELDGLLRDERIRLVTILAPGGMGKTRLALQAARQQLLHFADGVFLVQLAALNTPDAILPAIADSFELSYFRNESGDLKQSVLSFLHSQHMLLVMDNFEHLLDGAGLVSDMLNAAPNLVMLVTSRERLNLQGETVFTLTGMPYPGDRKGSPPEYDSLTLFVQSARRVRPDYELNAYDLPYVAEICRLVDGMPLGIELAAGWMDVLNAEKIAAEVRRCIDFLETDMRDVPERQRSVRATIQRSWESLSDSEQGAMMRLSVFRGGFTQEAAEATAGATLRILRQLVNKALLVMNPFGRYEIHELVRQFSEEKLRDSGAYEATRTAHALYYFGLAERLGPMLADLQSQAFHRLHADHDNLSAAWHWLIDQGNFDPLFSALEPLWSYLSVEGNSYEVREWYTYAMNALEPLLEQQADLRRLYALLLIYSLNTFMGLLEMEQVWEYSQQALTMLEPFGATPQLAEAYRLVGMMNYLSPGHEIREHALHWIQKALDLSRQLDLPDEIANSLQHLAYFHLVVNGDNETAVAMAREAYDLVKASSLSGFVNYGVAVTFAEILIEAGRPEEAQSYAEEALEIVEPSEWVYGISNARTRLIIIANARGDVAIAKRHAASVIRWHQTHARDWQMLGALYGTYAEHLLIPLGEDVRAAEILAFVPNHPLVFRDALDQTRLLLEELRARMEPSVFEAACERGRRKTLAQMVDEAMAWLTE